jgi:hypothetical protein
MMRKLAFILAAGVLLVAAGHVHAQQKGPNGGLVSGTGGHQTELVVTASELTVFLLEDGKPHDSEGTTLRAVVQQGGKTTTINFADKGGNKLVAKLPAPLAKGAIVVLSGKDHHGERLNARYVLK